MSYEGSCHCGEIRFTVEGDPPTSAISCDCSHCRRKGLLLTLVPADAVQMRARSDRVGVYRFNRHVIEHRVCLTCGCEPLAYGKGDDGGAVAAINLRCVPSIPLDDLALEFVNGAAR